MTGLWGLVLKIISHPLPPVSPFPALTASCHLWEGSTIAHQAEPERDCEQGSASISSLAKDSVASKLELHILEQWPVLEGRGGWQ